jgi:hypothetical protein
MSLASKLVVLRAVLIVRRAHRRRVRWSGTGRPAGIDPVPDYAAEAARLAIFAFGLRRCG